MVLFEKLYIRGYLIYYLCITKISRMTGDAISELIVYSKFEVKN